MNQDEIKKQIKNNISVLINSCELNEAKNLIDKYMNVILDDVELLSMKAVVDIMEGNIDDAEEVIKKGLNIDSASFDLNYNLAYIYEKRQQYLKALELYEKIVFNMEDNIKRKELIEYLNQFEERNRSIIQKQLDELKTNENISNNINDKELNLHLMYDSQYCDRFIHFINEHFDNEKHFFIIIGSKEGPFKFMHVDGIKNVDIVGDENTILDYINKSSRVFIHYLFDYFCNLVCKFDIKRPLYWILWGGDYYNYIDIEMHDLQTRMLLNKIGWNTNSSIDKSKINYIKRKSTIRKIDYIICSDDSEYISLKANTIMHAQFDLFIYPSLLKSHTHKWKREDNQFNFKKDYKYVVLAGNSANHSNNHIEMLYKLNNIKSNDFCIVMPLSYGGFEQYVNLIVSEGKKLFKERFIPLIDYLNSDTYGYLLDQVDVALFNHNRAQARGNIRELLYKGKKVYIKKQVTTYSAFTKQGLKLYDIDSIQNDLDMFANIEERIIEENRSIIQKKHYSNQALEYYRKLNF